MKLNKLNESIKNDFMSNADEIDDYIKNVLEYKSKYVINDDFSVDFLDDVKIKSTDIDYLRIKTNDCLGNFFITHSSITTTQNLPKSCKILGFIDCPNIQENLILETLTAYGTQIDETTHIESIITFDKRLTVQDYVTRYDMTMDTKHIEFKNDSKELMLVVGNCGKILSFKQIIAPSKSFKELSIIDSGIISLKDFDFSVHDYCKLRLPNLVNFYNINNVNIGGTLEIDIFNNLAYLVNICLNTSRKIRVRYDNSLDGNKISIMLNDLVSNMQQRKENIMDVATFLIDAGYEEAAEL